MSHLSLGILPVQNALLLWEKIIKEKKNTQLKPQIQSITFESFVHY